MTRSLHVYPLNDSAPHDLTPRCRCAPCFVDEGRGVWVHTSFDAREFRHDDGADDPGAAEIPGDTVIIFTRHTSH